MLIHHFLEHSAQKYPGKVALVCDGNRYTYDDVNSAATQFAAAVIDTGIPKGGRAVVFLENTFEAVVAIFGILKAGLIFIPVNPGVKQKKLHYILEDSSAQLMICSFKNRFVVAGAVLGLETFQCLVWCDGVHPFKGDKHLAHLSSWEDFMEGSGTGSGFFNETLPENKNNSVNDNLTIGKNSFVNRNPLINRRVTIDCDLANIIYTSGSTGEPKGVMCTHRNVVFASSSITHYLGNTCEDVIINVLPLSFDYGLYQVFMTFKMGGTLVLEKNFGFPYKILEIIEHEKVTGFPIVPSMASLFFHLKQLDRFRLSSLRYITNTAANLSVEYIRRLQKAFPDVDIYCMYGLTECKRVLYLPPEMIKEKPGSVGIAIPGTRVFIVDENGDVLEPGIGSVGELVVTGSHVMQGYWNKDKATAHVFRRGRYRDDVHLYTGDLFKQDREGFLYFVGRKDDMIKTRGERVSPREIEDVILGFDHVGEVAVMGVPDEMIGQAVKAFVVPEQGCCLSKTEILKYCRENMEAFMIPKHIEIIEQLKKTRNGKVDKKILK